MCNNVQNSAVIKDIFMKFDTKVLNWTLNDYRNFYQKQALDGEIMEFNNTKKIPKVRLMYKNVQTQLLQQIFS